MDVLRRSVRESHEPRNSRGFLITVGVFSLFYGIMIVIYIYLYCCILESIRWRDPVIDNIGSKQYYRFDCMVTHSRKDTIGIQCRLGCDHIEVYAIQYSLYAI